MQFQTPILFLIFNREDTTRKVFEVIRQQKPKYLYVAADGARKHKPNEAEICRRVRDIIQVDWDCELKTLYRDENLGCKMAVSSAITWFFENVEQGIILEDDCLPHSDFFPYCEELLAYYRNNDSVALISGTKVLPKNYAQNASYYFSESAYIWSWATWKRFWKHYDLNKKYSCKKLHQLLKRNHTNKLLIREYLFRNQLINWKKVDTWDTQLGFPIWENKMCCIIPARNLITNIGFDANALHTKNVENPLSNLPTFSIMPLTHPPMDVNHDYVIDNYLAHGYKPWWRYWISAIRYLLFVKKKF